MKSFVATAVFATLAAAFTPPGAQTYGSLLTPNLQQPVTTGQQFTITWQPKQPADGVTVSLVLCKGPSTNCVIQTPAIVEGIPAGTGSYNWDVPCSLTPGTQQTDTGYGMLIIVDGTGEFQYSTQYSVLQGSSCSSSTTTTTTTTTSSKSSTSSTTSKSSSSTTSGSITTTSSTSNNNGGWYGWSSTTSNSTVVLPTSYTTTTVKITPTPIITTSSMMTSTYSMITSSTPPTPKPFTGAAAVPTAFANAAGIFGAAVLGMMAL